MTRHEMLSVLSYFWNEKDDIERWLHFDRDLLQQEFPELLKVWDDYKMARHMVDVVLKGLE